MRFLAGINGNPMVAYPKTYFITPFEPFLHPMDAVKSSLHPFPKHLANS